MAVKCFTCGKQDSILCFACFRGADHRGHKFYFLQGSGFCDCGNAEYLEKAAFCAQHSDFRVDEPRLGLQRGTALQKRLAALVVAMLAYTRLRPKAEIAESLRCDILCAWSLFFAKIAKDVKAAPNVLWLVLDTLVNREVLQSLPEQLVSELTAPVLSRLEREHSVVQENLKQWFGPDEESKAKLAI